MTGAAIERHPSDLLHLVVATFVAGIGLLAATEGSPAFEGVDRDLFELFSQGPHGLTNFVVELVQLLAVAVPVIGVIVLVLLRRFRALLYAVLATVLAGAIASLAVGSLVPEVPPRLASWLRTEGLITGYEFPDTVFVAVAMAVITVLVPWMNRSWRRFAWTLFTLAVLARILGGTTAGPSSSSRSGWVGPSDRSCCTGSGRRRGGRRAPKCWRRWPAPVCRARRSSPPSCRAGRRFRGSASPPTGHPRT